MKKSEFAALVSESAGIRKKEAERMVDLTFRCLGDALAQGERVFVSGFGVFETRVRAARTGRVPSTGEHIEIPAAQVPVFKPAKQLKEIINRLPEVDH